MAAVQHAATHMPRQYNMLLAHAEHQRKGKAACRNNTGLSALGRLLCSAATASSKSLAGPGWQAGWRGRRAAGRGHPHAAMPKACCAM
jgi:hypothetical protein